MRKSTQVAAAVGAIVLAGGLKAQQDSTKRTDIDEVVITKYYQKYKENNISSSFKIMKSDLEFPQHLTIIPAKVLEDQQILNFSEGVTRNVSGARKVEHWDNVYTKIYMRGAAITPLVNGMSAAYLPSNLIPPDAAVTERVEFVKGPIGMIGSMGDPAGFYNILLKSPVPRRTVRAGFTTGSYGLYRGDIDLGGALDKKKIITARLNTMLSTNKSWVDYDFNKKFLVNPALSISPWEGTKLTANFIYQTSKFAQPAAYLYSPNGLGELPINFTFNDPNFKPSTIKDRMLFLTLNQKIYGSWSLNLQYADMKYDHDGSNWGIYPFGEILGGSPTFFNRYIGKWIAHNKNRLVQGYVTGKINAGTSQHQIVAGADIAKKHYDGDFSPFEDYSYLFNTADPHYGIDPATLPPPEFYVQTTDTFFGADNQVNTYSYFVSDDVDMFNNKLHLNFTGRYTKGDIDNKGDKMSREYFTGRVGINYSITKDFSAYALRDESFIPQTGGFVFMENGVRRLVAFDDPQTGVNQEFGLKKDWFHGRLNTTASVYRIKRENLLTADKRYYDVLASILYSTDTKGFEFDLKGEVVKGLNGIVNYAYTDSKISKSMLEESVGQPSPGLARHVANAWLDYTFGRGALKNLSLRAGYQYQAQRFPWYLTSLQNSIKLPDLRIAAAGIGYHYKHYTANLIVNNLFNQKIYSGYKDIYGYYVYAYEAPRTWRLSLIFNL